jgi:putative inorganic carbon (HCO3(-)) transporter
MRIAKEASLPKGNMTNVALMVVLPLVMVAIAYFISTFGNVAGYAIMCAAIGVVICGVTVFFPFFGYYFAIIFSFFLFDIQRFLRVDLPLGTFVDILIYLVFLAIIFRKIQLKEPFWKYCYNMIVFVYVLVLLYSVIEIFNPMGAPWSVSFMIYRRFLTLIIFLYCSIQLFETREQMIRFLKIYFIFVMIAALYGCYQEWFGYPAYEMRSILSNPQGERLLSLGGGRYRKFSFFASPTDFGLLMAACVLMLLVFFLNGKFKMKKRIYLLAGMVLCALAMSYSGTRTATMTLVIGIMLYVLMTIANRRTLIFTSVFAALFVFLIYGPIYGNPTINRLRSTFDLSEDESYKVRDVNRHSIQPFIYENPLGGGLGTSGVGSSAFVPNHPLADFPSDSGLLRNAVEYGWVGIIVLYITYIVLLRQSVHAYFSSRNKKNRLLLLAATLALFNYIVAQYAQVAIGMIPSVFLIYALVAMVVRLPQIEFESQKLTNKTK